MTDQNPNTPTPTPGAAQQTPTPAGWEPPVDSGSQVVVVVSRGVSPTPVGVPTMVPDVVGARQGDALAKLQEAGLGAQVFNDQSATVARGKVVGQLPEAGLGAPKGLAVILMVSNGPAPSPPPQVGLPDVIGGTESEALSKLQAAGLVPQIVREYNPKVPEGVVIATLPNARSLAVQPKRSLTWLWVLLGVLAVLLLAGLWYVNQNQKGVSGLLLLTQSPVATATVEASTPVEATAPVEPAPTTTNVPNVVGMSQADAESALKNVGFAPLVTKVTTSNSPAGDVVAQVPAANTELTNGSQVAIQVAQAKAPTPPTSVKVPNVVGMTQANAQSALANAGLAPSFVNEPNAAPKGQAFDQEPNAGGSVAPNSVVLVAISAGPPPPAPEPTTVAVPKVTGKKQADAEKAVADAKLTSQVVETYDDTAAKGTVFRQWPPAGNKVAPGTPVALVVSMGSKPTSGTATVPDVKGMDANGATQALADAELVAEVVRIDDPEATPNVVLGQLPAAGSIVPAGSTVLIGIYELVATPY
jgi:beta-lactam-binding protein with PASTA domain